MHDEQHEKHRRELLQQAHANPITSGRNCGICTLCCKVLEISELEKPAGVWCSHCKPGTGCTIHSERPQECRDFYCGYLTSPDLGEEWKPSHAKFLITRELSGNRITVHVDPERPDAWRREPYYSTLKQLAKQAAGDRGQVLVFIGKQLHVLLPDRDVDLGIMGKDEVLFTQERMTPQGLQSEVFKIRKDDPRARGLAAKTRGETAPLKQPKSADIHVGLGDRGERPGEPASTVETAAPNPVGRPAEARTIGVGSDNPTAQKMDVGKLHIREYWRSFAPNLHIEDRSLFASITPLQMPPQHQKELSARLNNEGYFQASADWGVDLKLMADTVRSLSKANLSPVFAFLYDEFWHPFHKLHSLYSGLLGGNYRLLPDFWIWNVDPTKGESGWTPHRDAGRISLFDDGSPKSLTTWIPLSSATPLNGCMYVVPALHDPTYGTAEEMNWKIDFPTIRALPADPGDFLIWNQAVLHWGGKTAPHAPESRVSMAFEFQRADVAAFNTPLIEPLLVIPFETRLKLIAKQILQYQHMYKLEPNVAKFAFDVLNKPVETRNPNDPSTWGKVGRNERCPCGSGNRYKQCHGRLLQPDI